MRLPLALQPNSSGGSNDRALIADLHAVGRFPPATPLFCYAQRATMGPDDHVSNKLVHFFLFRKQPSEASKVRRQEIQT